MKHLLYGITLAILCAACGDRLDTTSQSGPALDSLAQEYLLLELNMGHHDPAHVDAYFGPEELQTRADEQQLSLDEIEAAAIEMKRELSELPETAANKDRILSLQERLTALLARININRGELLSFDDESMQLFAAVAPNYDAAHFDAILSQIDELIPGDGPLSERVISFTDQFIVPPEKLAAVFEASIDECRRRTLENIDLPENETFTIEYVEDKPWSGYNWYQGNATSLIQVNTDFPIPISRAVDLGCHEGYPGHHTLNVLVEENLVQEAGWVEFSLYPLFSPSSLVAEGSGNYGIVLAFPDDERLEYETSVLFPLAGLDPTNADVYYQLLALMAQLNYAGNEAARDYLNGDISREQAIEWLTKYRFDSEEKAAQGTRFFDTYRSYVINYNLGQDMVREYIEAGDPSSDERWQRFTDMLSSPVRPAEMR